MRDDWEPGQRSHVLALDERFDAGTLAGLRKAVLDTAKAAGLTDDRAVDVMIAVNELVSNAVLYGGGAGRVRISVNAGELLCHVADAGPARSGGHAPDSSTDRTPAWPVSPGHGLWILQRAADRFAVTSGPGGSEVSAFFRLPGLSRDVTGS